MCTSNMSDEIFIIVGVCAVFFGFVLQRVPEGCMRIGKSPDAC